MSTILVTGGAGFIGSNLIENLLADSSINVIAIDNFHEFYDPAAKRRNIQHYIAHPRFTFYECDICNPDSLHTVLNNHSFDCIIHLAALAGVRPSLLKPTSYVQVNVAGTLNILEYARHREIPQIIFASSSSVYGETSVLPFREDMAVATPISPYAATKISGELLCHTYAHQYGIRIICLRFFTVYGPRQRPDLAIRRFVHQILTRQPITLYGDGTSSRDYTWVGDIVAGVQNAIQHRNFQYEIINLGNSFPIRTIDLIAAIEEATGLSANITFGPPQQGDMPHTFADITKAQSLLNYHPTTHLQEGLQRFVEWYQQELQHTMVSSLRV